MCNPLQLIGGAVAALGARTQGRRTSKAQRVAAEIARINADLAARQGATRQTALGRQINRTIAGQTRRFAAGNLDPNVGSPLALAAFTAGQGEIDRRLIAAETAADVASALGGAAAAEQRAVDARSAGFYGAATALLSAGSQAWPSLQGAFRRNQRPLSQAAQLAIQGGTGGLY